MPDPDVDEFMHDKKNQATLVERGLIRVKENFSLC
jgi:hypothetical protein